MATLELMPAGTAQSGVSNQPTLLTEAVRTLNDHPSRISDDLLGAILLMVASKGNIFDSNDNENMAKNINDVLNQQLPTESVFFGMRPDDPVTTASTLTAFSHALVCKRWLRVARSVHPAIVVPRSRFFSARTLGSLLTSPTLGFPNLRHLHLGEFALDSVDSHLVESICTGPGSSLTHLTIYAYDCRQVASWKAAAGSAQQQAHSSNLAGISSSDVAAIFSSCTRLVYLDLRLDDGVLMIPGTISCLQQLTQLGLCFSKITELPEELLSLSRLRGLHLSSPSLRSLPDSFGRLASLEHVALCSCPMRHLPSDLGNLKGIKRLILSQLQRLTELPASICQLPVLSRVSIEHCPQFLRLPDDFFQLPSLDVLHLKELAALTALPDSFSQLLASLLLAASHSSRESQSDGTCLAASPILNLTIDSCPRVTSLPENIDRFSSLQILCLKFVPGLTALPDSLGLLTALKELRVVECRNLWRLPASVSGLSSLFGLTLDGCFIGDLPLEIGQLRNLATVKLLSDRLAALPESLGQLGNLKQLFLYECYNLHELPDSFSTLSSLETLMIYGGSSLVRLPPGFEKLPQLHLLELVNCGIRYLPERFGHLPNLEFLEIRSAGTYKRVGINYEPAPRPAHPECESEGEEFDLAGSCEFRRFPESFHLLTRLEELVIDGCEMVEELPTGMGDLSSLKKLTLKNCKRLRTFPSLLPTAISTPPTGPSATASTSSSVTPSPLPLPSLLVLEISSCPRLANLPEGFDLLPKVMCLTIEDCTNPRLALRSSASPSLPSSSSSSPAAAPISFPRSIESIQIANSFRSAHYLPESFLSLSRLVYLYLYDLQSLKHLIAPPRASGNPSKTEAEDGTGADAPAAGVSGISVSVRQAPLESLSCLVHLQIVNTNLPSLPDNLGDLRELAVLFLERCHAMTSLPSSLTRLFKLRRIYLKTLPLLTHLPGDFGQLTALNEFHLESCKALQNFSPSFVLPSSLLKLSIVDCPDISRLPDSLSSLTRLSSLKLNGLPALQQLPSSLPLASLVKLSLQGCKLLRVLPSNLGSLSCLREVDLVRT